MKANEVVLVAEQRWREKNKAKLDSLKINRKLGNQARDDDSGLYSGPVIAIVELPRRQMLIDGDSDNREID
jgi:hypothetical protein